MVVMFFLRLIARLTHSCLRKLCKSKQKRKSVADARFFVPGPFGPRTTSAAAVVLLAQTRGLPDEVSRTSLEDNKPRPQMVCLPRLYVESAA